MTVNLTRVELTLLVEALDEYIEKKTEALGDGTPLRESEETRLSILDDITDVLASVAYAED